MKNRSVITLALCSLLVTMLACNLSSSPTSSQPDYVATITAQAAELGQPTTEASTPIASAVTANVTATTNCRSGPGTSYGIVTTLKAGQQVAVVGQDAPDAYWIVDEPGGSGTCWLWGQVATITGDPSALPQTTVASSPASTSTPKATKTPKPAAGPLPNPLSNVFVGTSSCKLTKTKLGTYNYDMQFYISWSPPTGPSVDGYHVYRDGTLISTFEVGAVSYQDQITINGVSAVSLPTEKYTYQIAAYNKAGESPRSHGSAQCPQ